MAKKSNGPSKSQSIRDYLETNPRSKAKETVAGLSEKGIKVSENLVYGVMGGLKEKKRRKKRVAKAAMSASMKASSNGRPNKPDAITLIRSVRALADQAGGFAKLKELVDALAE